MFIGLCVVRVLLFWSAIDFIGVGPLPVLGLVLDSGDDPWSSLSACGTDGWYLVFCREFSFLLGFSVVVV